MCLSITVLNVDIFMIDIINDYIHITYNNT